ncbi:MAG TPA: PASTA domain-containing protein [Trueperaceae bacterium]
MAAWTKIRGQGGLPSLLKQGRVRFLLLGALLFAFFVWTVIATRDYLDVGEVTLPNTIGMDADEAIRSLERLDLTISNYPENVPGAPVHSVTSQTPSPGTVVRRGRNVSLGINIPPEDTQVPQLVGLDLQTAGTLLAKLKLEIGAVRYQFSRAPDNQVLSQDPAPGEVMTTGQGIILTVSRGPEPKQVVLPDVRGLPLEEAQEQLDKLGFRLVEPVPTGVSFSRPGVVNAQRPAPGESVSLSTRVLLEFSLSSGTVVPVPDLQGVSLERAQYLLKAARLDLAWDALRYVDDPAKPQGVVEYQPKDYTLVGTPVVVTVNGSPTGANAPTRLPGLADVAPAAGDGLVTRDGRDVALGRQGTDQPQTPAVGPSGEEEPRSLLDQLFGQADRQGDAAQDTRTEADDQAVSEALPEGARRVPIKFDPADVGLGAGQSYEFVLRIQDERGDRIGIERTLAPGATVDTSVVVYGDTLLQIELDGTIFMGWNPY